MDPAITASLATGLAGYLAYIVPLPPLLIRLVGVASHLGTMHHEHFQHADKRGFPALDHLAEAGSAGFSDVLGICLPAGIVVELRALYGAASRISCLWRRPLRVGVVGAFFSFGGWWDVSKIAGEVRDPGRTLPRALCLGCCAVTVFTSWSVRSSYIWFPWTK